jgi:vacuolar-type H+-ATPase subunit H
MRRIVKEIFDAESRVDAILQQARERAAEIRRAADKEMSERVSDARRQAQGIAQAVVEEARKEVAGIREDALRRADQQGSALRSDKAEVMDELLNRICAALLNTEREMDDQ